MNPRVNHSAPQDNIYYAATAYSWSDNPDLADWPTTYTKLMTLGIKTQVKLFTGGKAIAGRQNLFGIQCSATELLKPPVMIGLPWAATEGPTPDELQYQWNYEPSQAMDLTALTVLGKHPGSDGIVWAALPDNSIRDITITAPGIKHFTADAEPTKYKPYITDNGTPLDPDKVNVTNCVGQQVKFALAWDPDWPPLPYVSLAGQWNLPQKFVNEQWQAKQWISMGGGDSYWQYYGSINYRINDAFLQNTNQTSCWFVNGTGGKVVVGVNLLMENGQNVSIAADGNIAIYRPTAQTTFVFSPFYFTLSGITSVKSTLQLGDNDGAGSMHYELTVNSKYSGLANITQLITLGYSNPFYSFSDERCDGAPPYNKDDSTANYYGTIIIYFQDGPGETWEDPNTVSITARDFVQFSPGGAGDIYVTLGVVHWSASATARQYSLYGDWFIQSPSVTGPDDPDDSDEFPVWTQIQTAH